jgi:hypothetical protein
MTIESSGSLYPPGRIISTLADSLVNYPGMQERLLQELIDNDIDADTPMTADLTDGEGQE